jgi:outer membrane protein, heavy metal efflux system
MFVFAPVRAHACSSRGRACLTLFASFGLAACATTAGSQHYDTLSSDFSRSSSLSRSAPEKEPSSIKGPVLERAAFVRAVLERNPSIESARQGWRAAIARTRQAGSFDDPMLDLGVAPLSIGASKATFGYEVGISQQLPWFGKRSLDANAAAAEAEAGKSDYEGVRRELALTASNLYDQYFVAQRSLDINAAHVKLMSAMRDSAIAQFGSGHGSAQDSLQAEAELTHMEHDTIILASQREILVAQMNELLHRAPELPLPPPPGELPAPGTVKSSVASLQTEAIERRPDIAAAREHARAQQAKVDRAERDYYPDFTVSTSYNSMWDMPEHRWMVGLGLSLPIWTGKRSAMAEEATAMRAQFESDVARMSDMVRTQVFVSMKQLEESEHVLRLFETRLLPVAREQIDAARAGFITSQNPFVAVIDAERNLRNVELEYEMKRADFAQRRAQLDRALGRIPGLDWKGSDR